MITTCMYFLKRGVQMVVKRKANTTPATIGGELKFDVVPPNEQQQTNFSPINYYKHGVKDIVWKPEVAFCDRHAMRGEYLAECQV